MAVAIRPCQPVTGNRFCLSNCGKYKFPTELGKDGCDPTNDPNCYSWTTFCAGNEAIKYNNRCITGKCPTNNPNCVGQRYTLQYRRDCLQCNPGDPDFHIACFKNAGPTKLGECQLRGFQGGTVAPCNGTAGTKCGPAGTQCAAPTSTIACTNTYGSINPLDIADPPSFDYNDQPIVAPCSDVRFEKTGMQFPASVKTPCTKCCMAPTPGRTIRRSTKATPRCIAWCFLQRAEEWPRLRQPYTGV